MSTRGLIMVIAFLLAAQLGVSCGASHEQQSRLDRIITLQERSEQILSEANHRLLQLCLIQASKSWEQCE